MSTNIIPTNSPQATVNNDGSSDLTLDALVETLDSLRVAPALEEIDALLREVAVRDDELRPHLGFKNGTYARHRVFRNEFAELMVLCWQPGQKTPIHDHNGSFGAVRVLQGIMWETMFGFDEAQKICYRSAREWQSGLVTGADVPDIHQLGNPEVSGQNLITLHIYAPPLGVLNTYKVGSTEIGHYTPDEFMDGAGI
jgi:cysteine dioxygenase